MIRPLPFFSLLIFTLSLYSAGYDPIKLDPTYKHDKFKTQTVDKLKKFRAYTVSFDGRDGKVMTGLPEWVSYEIRAHRKLKKGPKRPKWIEDNTYKYEAPADASYKHSGYDRGHMCPKFHAWRLGKEADHNTHTTLNACPQIHAFNGGIWLDLEMKTAKWADKFKKIWVICGPAFKNKTPSKWIGEKAKREMRVAVPDYFWKIIVRQTSTGLETLAFLYPHKNIKRLKKGRKKRFDQQPYIVSIDRVEEVTGLDFFTVLPKAQEKLLESRRSKVWQ